MEPQVKWPHGARWGGGHQGRGGAWDNCSNGDQPHREAIIVSDVEEVGRWWPWGGAARGNVCRRGRQWEVQPPMVVDLEPRPQERGNGSNLHETKEIHLIHLVWLYSKVLLSKLYFFGSVESRRWKTIQINKDNWVQRSSIIKSIVPLPKDLKVHCLIRLLAAGVRRLSHHTLVKMILKRSYRYHATLHHVRTFHLGLTTNQAYILSNQHTFHGEWKAFITFLSENQRWNFQSHTISKLWNWLWEIKSQLKLKIILWRMAHDCVCQQEREIKA